jgi:hypothetical protein
MLLPAVPALAQGVEVQPLEAPSIARWLVLVLTLLLVGIVCLATFKDAKRRDQQ